MRPKEDGSSVNSGSAAVPDGWKPIIAFGIVGFVLITASDFEATSPLATAFAGVILLSTVLLVGPVAFNRVSKLVS